MLIQSHPKAPPSHQQVDLQRHGCLYQVCIHTYQHDSSKTILFITLSGTKKKRHSSEYAKEKSVTSQQEMIPPPELPVIAPVTDSDDYFDLRSTGAADLLLPTSRYSFLKDPVIKSTSSSPPPRPSASMSANPVTHAKHPPSTKKKNNDIQSAKAMEDAMDNLAKVLEESSMAFTTEEEEEQQQQDEEVALAAGQEKTEARLLQHQQQDRRTATFSPFWRSSPSSAGKNNKPTLTLQRRSTRIRSNSNASSTSSSTAASSPPTSPPSRWASFEQARAFSSLALSPKDQQQQQRPLSTFTTTSSIVNTSSSLDSAPFMNQPPAIVSPVTIHLSLMQRLSRSMVEGAYLTERLYVPKELW